MVTQDIHIIDSISAVADKNPSLRELIEIEQPMFHRIKVPGGHTAAGIAIYFREHHLLTGIYHMPYTIVVSTDGTIEQALPLTTRAPHAASWNPDSIGVGVVGDFRWGPPTDRQLTACRFLNRWLGQAFLPDWPGVGHTDVDRWDKRSTHRANHSCPGAHFPMVWMNARSLIDVRVEARSLLASLGMVF